MDWWLQSSPFSGLGGGPCGPPEWPRPGGIMRQPNKLVAAVRYLRSSLPVLLEAKAKKNAPKDHATKRASRGSARRR